MKIVVNIKDIPTKDSMLVYDGENWECISKYQLLKDVPTLKKEFAELEAKVEQEIANLKKQVNDKLKDYHIILQNLVKED